MPERPVRLTSRTDLKTYAPAIPDWGYAGSGPAQLALDLAADVLGDSDRALAVHQALKNAWVSTLPRHCWSITAPALVDLIVKCELANQKKERANHGG